MIHHKHGQLGDLIKARSTDGQRLLKVIHALGQLVGKLGGQYAVSVFAALAGNEQPARVGWRDHQVGIAVGRRVIQAGRVDRLQLWRGALIGQDRESLCWGRAQDLRTLGPQVNLRSSINSVNHAPSWRVGDGQLHSLDTYKNNDGRSGGLRGKECNGSRPISV